MVAAMRLVVVMFFAMIFVAVVFVASMFVSVIFVAVLLVAAIAFAVKGVAAFVVVVMIAAVMCDAVCFVTMLAAELHRSGLAELLALAAPIASGCIVSLCIPSFALVALVACLCLQQAALVKATPPPAPAPTI